MISEMATAIATISKAGPRVLGPITVAGAVAAGTIVVGGKKARDLHHAEEALRPGLREAIADCEQAQAAAEQAADEYGRRQLAVYDQTVGRFADWLEQNEPGVQRMTAVIADRDLVAAPDVPPGEVGRVQALRTFNHMIVTDSRLQGVILPLGDGLAYAVRV